MYYFICKQADIGRPQPKRLIYQLLLRGCVPRSDHALPQRYLGAQFAHARNVL